MTQHVNDFLIPISVADAVAAETIARFVAPYEMQILGVTASARTAPAGSAMLIDVHIDGSTVFTTQGDRVSIAAGAKDSAVAKPNANFTSTPQTGHATDYESGGVAQPGDVVEVIVDQVGSGTAGSDLMVLLHCKRL